MISSEIRRRFIEYFAGRGHEIVASSALIPKADPTLLFTNSGMVQFKGVFLNEEKRDYKRAVTCQKCVRAGGKHNDLENVGRTARHHTFFEMLGNFSFGDYFKAEAVDFAWDFLTKEMKLPVDKLWVTVFEDDSDAADIWAKKKGSAERIVRMGAKDNFWSMGDTGPCGPCSEILIDQGEEAGCGSPDCKVGCDCDRFLEIWNLVFMQFNRDSSGNLTPLPNASIDTGMGLERLSAVMQGKKNNYDSDLFLPIIRRIEELSSVKYNADRDSDVSIRAIADHARSICFLMADGVLPGNEGRGYVLRRIIRRAARHGKFLGIKDPFIYKVNETVIERMGAAYPELNKAKDFILRATNGEEERFLETLDRGLTLLDEEIRRLKDRGVTVLTGEAAFKLYDTFGFPIDLTADIIKKEGFTVDEDGFNGQMAEQKKLARLSWKGGAAGQSAQELYRALFNAGIRSEFVGYHIGAASGKLLCIIKDGSSVETAFDGDTVEIITDETPFYGESGGQAGDTGVIVGSGFNIDVIDTKRPLPNLTVHVGKLTSGAISVDDNAELIPDPDRRNAARRNHTATHLLHAALRKTIGEHVKQAGSLVTPDGLRFDFSHFEPLSRDAINKIEAAVNNVVIKNIPVVTEVLAYKAAVEKGALAFFGEKYGELVRMVDVSGFSTELCGGTHVSRTGDIGLIRITAEGSVAGGVRRIEAITGSVALSAVQETERALRESAQMLKVPGAEVPEKIRKLLAEQRELQKEIDRLGAKTRGAAAGDMAEGARTIKGVTVLSLKVEAKEAKELRDTADALRVKLKSGVVVLSAVIDGKVVLLSAVTKDLTERLSAGEIVKRLAPIVGGKGGGKGDLAQAGGALADKIDEAVAKAYAVVEELL